MKNLIFGKTWEEIQQMQNGTYLPKTVDLATSGKQLANKQDVLLLEQHGITGLREKGFFGVIDRLTTSGYIE